MARVLGLGFVVLVFLGGNVLEFIRVVGLGYIVLTSLVLVSR